MGVSRRDFLTSAAAVSVGFSGLHTFLARNAFASPTANKIADGFGPLVADPEGVLDLPEGFSYRIISRVGDEMADGMLVPGKQDGMAAFPGPDGTTLVVCNHEVSTNDLPNGGFGENNERAETLGRASFYDFGSGETPALGGTTTLVYDTQAKELRQQSRSLAGTIRNCAGGPTPWGSWLSCEEDVTRADDVVEKNHGYVFEVPASARIACAAPAPILDMGRFNHEAVAVDPKSGIVFQTEDRDDGLIYRYIPNAPGKLHEGGTLQALAYADTASVDTRNWDAEAAVAMGDKLPVRWIDMEDIHAPEDDLRTRGFDMGAARFARGEGMWYGREAVYFACTSGGYKRKGQIWRYVPSPAEGTAGEADAPGTLELFVEPNDGNLVEAADNLTVSPWGDLIVCEDGSGEQFLVGVTPEGGLYKFARNATPGNSEFAGACFSPDGSTLFVNIQHDGWTLAITGPWQEAVTA